MCYWIDNHGNTYGPFDKQKDGFPNAGQVILFYREKMGLTQLTLALKLGVRRQTVIDMEKHNQVPQNLSRRRAIADLLKIPPVLLGLSVVSSDAYLMPLEDTQARLPVGAYSVEEANEYLDEVWDTHTFTGSLSMLPGVRRWKAKIREQVERGGSEHNRNLELLHRYEHFLLRAGRTKQDYTGTDPEGLIKAAEQLEDPEMLGISLYQRGKMYYERKAYKEALGDVQEALKQVENAGPRVKGLVLSGASEILAHYAADKKDVDKIRKNLDAAYRRVEETEGYPDPFHTKFDESGYYLIRASSIILLLRLDPTLINEVWEALDLAKEKTKPYYTRRRANIERLYSEAAFYSRNYTSTVSTALEALELAQSIGSVWNIENIQNLYNKLTQTKIKDSKELRELRDALK